MSKVPSRLAEPQLVALAKANQVRCERAQLKRELAAGRVEIEVVISDPPAFAQRAILRDLLLALPKVGPTRADRALTRCQISANKTVDALSDRQRVALIELLPL
jgi:hypothetical protein